MHKPKWMWPMVAAALLLVVAVGPTQAFDFSSIEDRVTEITLDNGLMVLVIEDHSAPVASFVTWADVGSADDPKGQTGMAHVFEHMAFKGNNEVGTTDPKAEAVALAKVDEAFMKVRAERLKGMWADSTTLAKYEEDLKAAQEAAEEWVVQNEFGKIIEAEGGVGLNAGTGYDQTVYFFSLPSNRAELWFALESGRFLDPVPRQYYKEVDVVKEERRMRTESSPIGRLIEEFLATAYKAHSYSVPPVGHMSDLHMITREQALDFFKKYYVPSNLVVAICGDVDPKQMKKYAKQYFGRIPYSPKPEKMGTVEPPQQTERRTVMEDKSQPFYIVGWHRPSALHPDDAALSALADYLGQGRTSLLYKNLVKDKKMAVSVGAMGAFPGDKYPTLFGVYAVPSKGVTGLACEEEIFSEVEKVKAEPIPEEELVKIKARAKANFINGLSSRQGLAMQLAAYQTQYGDWRQMFKELDDINAVTTADIQRVANTYLTRSNRSVGYIETVEEES